MAIVKPPCDAAAILTGRCELPATSQGRRILAATILGSSMAFIDGTAVNVALPALQKDLHANLAGVQWVVESYVLFLSALLLIAVRWATYMAVAKFAVGAALFTAASAWCGLALNLQQLIVARGLQGIGGALLVPGSLALISANFAEKERGRAIGTWSGFTAILPACIADSGYEILDVLLVFEAGLVEDAVPYLPLENPLRSKRLHEEYRVVVSGQ
jgi:MFS family permease